LVKTEQKAKALLDQPNKGASFSKLATERSLCPSRKRSGDLGIFERGKEVREFELVSSWLW